MRSVRGGGPASNGADRARATGGSETTGGAEAVQSRFAVGADCCGALGCRRSAALLAVEADGERVLCGEHAAGWVRR